MKRSSRSNPTGPGSRGGRWHEPEWRREYHRRWRLNSPEYRERERLRRTRARVNEQGGDPGLVTAPRRYGILPTLSIGCVEWWRADPGPLRVLRGEGDDVIVTVEIPTPDGRDTLRQVFEFGADPSLPMAYVAAKLEEWRTQVLEWWQKVRGG